MTKGPWCRRLLAVMLALPAWLPVVAAGQPVDPSGPAIGAAAPAFHNVAADGTTYSLPALKGMWVVLEWFNPSCPFARTHYDSGAMQSLQARWTGRGVVWLTVSTSARIERATAFARAKKTAATAVLDDSETRTAVAYQARTTPHLFVIDPQGVLVYKGAVDDRPDGNGLGPGRNFVDEALTSAMAGRSVETPVTTPYGCAVHAF